MTTSSTHVSELAELVRSGKLTYREGLLDLDHEPATLEELGGIPQSGTSPAGGG